MRIVYFTDIHGNQYAYHELIKKIDIISPDLVVFGGDIFGYYYGQEEIICDIKNREFICLLGNHDRMFLDFLEGKISKTYLVSRYGNSYLNIERKISVSNIEFIKNLKPEYNFKTDGLNLYFAHGSKRDPLNGRIYPDTDLSYHDEYKNIDFAFLGHTHHKMIRTINGCTIINPGSSGQQRDGKGCKYLIFDTVSKCVSIDVIDYDRMALQKEIEQNDTGEMRDKLIEVLYRNKL